MAMRRTTPLIVLFLALQVGFWYYTHNRRPEMDIVPDVPGEATLHVLAFGDEQFLFRAVAFDLGNAGDTFGRFTALYQYDMNKLYQWFTLLDKFDHTSNLLPTLAAYYFSQTQNVPDVRYMIRYLDETSRHDLKDKWWWQTQAVYLALHRLKDKDLALTVAKPLTEARNVPVWVQQMPAFVYEQRGEFDDAAQIMKGILDNAKDIPAPEARFMQYFVDERLHRLEELTPDEKGRLLPLLPPGDPGTEPAHSATDKTAAPGR